MQHNDCDAKTLCSKILMEKDPIWSDDCLSTFVLKGENLYNMNTEYSNR